MPPVLPPDAATATIEPAEIAHAIRNPLTSLKVRLFSIHRMVRDDPKLDARFAVVFEEIERIEQAIEEHLDN